MLTFIKLQVRAYISWRSYFMTCNIMGFSAAAIHSQCWDYYLWKCVMYLIIQCGVGELAWSREIMTLTSSKF